MSSNKHQWKVGDCIIEPNEIQRNILKKFGLNPNNWLICFENKVIIEVISKRSRQRRTLNVKENKCRS